MTAAVPSAAPPPAAGSRARRVKQVLLVCVCLSVALVLSQTAWTVVQDRRLTLASAHASGLVAVRLLDEHAVQTLGDAERDLDRVAAAVAAAGRLRALDDGAILDVITAGQRDSRFLTALQFVNRAGKPYVNSIAYPAFQVDIADRGYVPALLGHPAWRGARLGRPFQRYYDQELVLPLARNLYDGAGRHLGLLSIDINLSYFAGVYARMAKDSGALVALFADDGHVIVRTPFEPRYLNLDLSAVPLTARLRAAVPEGGFEDAHFLDLDQGAARQYTYRKLAGYGVTVVYAQPLDAILSDFNERSRERVGFAAVAIGCIGLLTAFLLHHMDRLQRSEREVRDLNAGLEQRVEQRTIKLEQANAELEQAMLVLQATQDELRRNEKLASLGAMVAGVAHELSTPIGNAIMMASSLQANAQQALEALRGARPSRAQLEQAMLEGESGAEVLVRNLMRAGQLVQSFKQVAVDQSSDQRRQFRLSRALEEVLATLEPKYLNGPYRMELALAADVEMDSYPGALAQILGNLIGNALAHGFEGRASGAMRLRTEPRGDGRVLIEFSDDGNGITPAVMERIFDPFFTTKLGQGGSGLGMHIVYNLVTVLLGGSITPFGAPGAGFGLRMVLPLVAPARARDADG